MTDTLAPPSTGWPVAIEPVLGPPEPSPYVGLSPAARTDVVEQLSGAIAALQAELGRVVVAVDRAGDHLADGATDVAAWLVWRTGATRCHAREAVRVAHALEHLPALRAALASGEVAFDQVRPVTRFATPATDDDLARELPGWSAGQAEAVARRLTPRPDDEPCTARARRTFHWRPDQKRGGFHYRGFLPAEAGEAVNAALSDLAEQAGPDAETGLWDPFGARCADALHDLAVGDRLPGQAALAVLHVESAALGGGSDGAAGPGDGGAGAEFGHGPLVPNGVLGPLAVHRRTVLRDLCDCDVEHAVEGPNGTTIGIGRRTRTVPDWLRRHIEARDGTCRFPGCERPIRHVHHNRHWTRDRGPTDSHNLDGLCWAHHHLVHEGRWEVTGDADGELTFTSPLGRRLTSRRPPIRPTTRAAAARISGTTLTVAGPEPP